MLRREKNFLESNGVKQFVNYRMKVDYQQAIEVQIKNSREELMSAEYVIALF